MAKVPVIVELKTTDGLSGPMARAASALERLSAPLRRLQGQFDLMQGRAKGFSDSMKRVGDGMSSVGKGLTMGVTAPLAGFAALSIKTALDFEDAMNGVAAKTGATGEAFTALREQALKLGVETRFSATEAAQGMKELGTAGFSVQEILEALPGTINLAVGSEMGLVQATETSAAVMKAYQLPVSQLGRVLDVLQKTADTTALNVSELGAAFKEIAPLASSFSIPIEESSAAIGLLAEGGIKGSQAGTALKAILGRLVKPSREAAVALTQLGIPRNAILDSQGRVKSLIGVLEQLKGAGAKPDDIVTLFGLDALPAITALMNMGADKLRATTTKIEDSQGALARVVAIMDQGGAGAIRRFMGSLRDLQLRFADSGILDAFTSIVRSLTDVLGRLAKASPGTLKFVAVLSLVAAAAGPVLLVLGGLTTMLAGLPAAIATLSTIGAVVAPIAGIGLAIGAALTFGYLFGDWVYFNWDAIVAKLTAGAQWISESVTSLVGLIKPALEGLATWISDTLEPSLTAAAVGIRDALASIAEWPRKKLGEFADWFSSTFAPLLSSGASRIRDAIVGLFSWGKGTQFGIPVSNASPGMGFKNPSFGPPSGISQITRDITQTQVQRRETALSVDFSNLPRGTRVSQTKRDDGAELNLKMGYQMVFP